MRYLVTILLIISSVCLMSACGDSFEGRWLMSVRLSKNNCSPVYSADYPATIWDIQEKKDSVIVTVENGDIFVGRYEDDYTLVIEETTAGMIDSVCQQTQKRKIELELVSGGDLIDGVHNTVYSGSEGCRDDLPCDVTYSITGKRVKEKFYGHDLPSEDTSENE